MPVSNPAGALDSLGGAFKALLMLLVVMLILSWLNQDSMRLYCQQKYHSSCELPGLNELPGWRLGADITAALGAGRDSFLAGLNARQPHNPLPADVVQLPANIPVVTLNVEQPSAPVTTSLPVQPVAPPAISAAPLATAPAAPAKVILEPGDEVFFIGDSLMQGVAPHLANSLLKRHAIKSINLSKQSTGLAYPGFFNWPQTVKDTLDSHRHIRLLVIFMGPNDPWDMPEARGKPFLRFKSEAWEHLYRQRVQAILDMAHDAGARVIWVGPPNMSAPKLSGAMTYLRELYRSETLQHRQLYLSANDVFGYQADEFSFYRTDEAGKRSKIRVDDGIHFTTQGQKLIANQVLSLIDVHTPGLSER